MTDGIPATPTTSSRGGHTAKAEGGPRGRKKLYVQIYRSLSTESRSDVGRSRVSQSIHVCILNIMMIINQ